MVAKVHSPPFENSVAEIQNGSSHSRSVPIVEKMPISRNKQFNAHLNYVVYWINRISEV